MKCFFSCSFHELDKEMVKWFYDLLAAFPDLEVIEAKNMPFPPSIQVEKCMSECQLFCAIVSRRGKGIPTWISNEIGMAHKQKMVIIAFVEDNISQKLLGILPGITEFKPFKRDQLGKKAPEYVKYIYNARIEVLKKQKRDRASLMNQIKKLNKKVKELAFAVSLIEKQHDRLDD
jgi:hypothetical protein